MTIFVKILSFRSSTKGFDDEMKNLQELEERINDMIKYLQEQGGKIIDVKVNQGVYLIMYEAEKPIITNYRVKHTY